MTLLLTLAFAWPRPVAYRESGPLHVGTYNMHYGYNTTWRLTLEEIARTIEESGADVVMLQEVDACRITSYGVDNGLWLARRLGMHVVFQPTLENLSGIALLTRFPIVTADGALLTSELEQTGIVHARLRVGDEEVDAYGIWLGLKPEERARQLTDALAFIGDRSPALLGGDFNSTPDSPVYARLVEAGFVDPFVALGVDPAPTSPAIEPRNRIDFVWGRGLHPLDASVPDSLASDHRMVITEWDLP
jgi:endonuclease/exonuclease/phosphatase family metal-dependent hydrolase